MFIIFLIGLLIIAGFIIGYLESKLLKAQEDILRVQNMIKGFTERVLDYGLQDINRHAAAVNQYMVDVVNRN